MKIDGYQFPPFRKDRRVKGGGKIGFIWHGPIVKRLKIFETKTAKIICVELAISKRKWDILFICKPTRIAKISFIEVSKTLSQAVNKYNNSLIAGYFNVDISNVSYEGTGYFSGFLDTFNVHNFMTKPTCCKPLKGSIIDLVLTNKPKTFQKASVCQTGWSDCHKLIFTILKSPLKKLPPEQTKYGS